MVFYSRRASKTLSGCTDAQADLAIDAHICDNTLFDAAHYIMSTPDILYMIDDVERTLIAFVGLREPRSDCASAQSNQDINCPLTESVDTVDLSDCVDVP